MLAFKPLLSTSRSLLRSRVNAVTPFITNVAFQSPFISRGPSLQPLPLSIASSGKKYYSSTGIIAAPELVKEERRGKKVLDDLRVALDLTDADVDILIRRD